jgi:hypothetical protein
MAPKVSKKTVSETKTEASSEVSTESSIEIIKQEWFTIVKEITVTTEKLSGLEKKRDELVSKLWNIMNKNPTEHIIEEPVEEKNASVKGVKKTSKPVTKNDIIDDSENADSIKVDSKPAKPVVKSATTKSKPKAEPKEEEPESDEEQPAAKPVDKPVAKSAGKTKPKAEVKPEVKPKAEVKPEVKKASATKKISAPVKGTPKPKIDEDSEDEKARPVVNDSSSESDVDSLSSVSSESDASGNDD